MGSSTRSATSRATTTSASLPSPAGPGIVPTTARSSIACPAAYDPWMGVEPPGAATTSANPGAGERLEGRGPRHRDARHGGRADRSSVSARHGTGRPATGRSCRPRCADRGADHPPGSRQLEGRQPVEPGDDVTGGEVLITWNWQVGCAGAVGEVDGGLAARAVGALAEAQTMSIPAPTDSNLGTPASTSQPSRPSTVRLRTVRARPTTPLTVRRATRTSRTASRPPRRGGATLLDLLAQRVSGTGHQLKIGQRRRLPGNRVRTPAPAGNSSGTAARRAASAAADRQCRHARPVRPPRPPRTVFLEVTMRSLRMRSRSASTSSGESRSSSSSSSSSPARRFVRVVAAVSSSSSSSSSSTSVTTSASSSSSSGGSPPRDPRRRFVGIRLGILVVVLLRFEVASTPSRSSHRHPALPSRRSIGGGPHRTGNRVRDLRHM